MMSSMLVMAALAASPVSLQYEGPLKDAIKQIAQKAELNVVVIGELNEPAQVNLNGVSGEDALDTIADAYGLEVKRSAKASGVWVIRKAGAGGVAAVAPVMPVIPAIPPIPPIPVIPSLPMNQGPNGAEQMRAEADEARASAEKLRAEAEVAREKLESMRSASQDARDAAREAYDEARERAQEAADEAREKAQEAAEEAREQAREFADAARERADAARDEAQAKAEVAQAQAELRRQRVSTGGPVTVEKGQHIDTAVAYGGPVIVEEGAVVEGDAVAFGGDVVLKDGAIVEGDAVSFGGTVVRGENSVVNGESVSMGGSGFGQTMARNMVKTQRTVKHLEHSEEDDEDHGFGIARFLLEFAVLFGLGFVMMMFAPQRMKAMEDAIRAEPVKNSVVGFLGGLAVFPLSLLLIVTVVGIPVALVLWMALAVALPVGLALTANVIGERIPTGKLRKTQALILAVGLLVMLVAFEIPVLGWFALFAVLSVAFGAMIRTRFGQPPKGTPVLDPLMTAPVL